MRSHTKPYTSAVQEAGVKFRMAAVYDVGDSIRQICSGFNGLYVELEKDNGMNPPPNKRMILIIVSAIDAILSGFVLLIYFGLLPIDISGWGIPRWVIGLVGGVWFVSAIAVLAYQLTKTETSE